MEGHELLFVNGIAILTIIALLLGYWLGSGSCPRKVVSKFYIDEVFMSSGEVVSPDDDDPSERWKKK